jgi:hypothetical protein
MSEHEKLLLRIRSQRAANVCIASPVERSCSSMPPKAIARTTFVGISRDFANMRDLVSAIIGVL